MRGTESDVPWALGVLFCCACVIWGGMNGTCWVWALPPERGSMVQESSLSTSDAPNLT